MLKTGITLNSGNINKMRQEKRQSNNNYCNSDNNPTTQKQEALALVLLFITHEL